MTRTNSPVPDSYAPYNSPEPVAMTPQDTRKEDQFAALGLDAKKYPEVAQYIQERQEYWRHYLPGNIPIEQVNFKNWHEFEIAQKTAANVISELEALISIIETSKDAVQRSRG